MLLLALREDGKIAVDAFYSDKLTEDEMAEYEAVKYADIVSIHGAVGIKYDGTLAFPEDNIQYTELGKWTDMIALSERDGTYVGLKSDGTVAVAGLDINLEDWSEMMAIANGGTHVVGLKTDGTVVAAGSNDYGQCNVTDWENIIDISAYDTVTIGLKRMEQ